MTQDKSPKACIHYTESGKIQLHTALSIPLKKGSQGAIIKGINQFFKVNKAPKELTNIILSFMPASQTESMKSASSFKRAVSKATTPEEKAIAVAEFTNSLDAEMKKLLGL